MILSSPSVFRSKLPSTRVVGTVRILAGVIWLFQSGMTKSVSLNALEEQRTENPWRT